MKTRQWDTEKTKPISNEDIHKIVGKVPITIDGNGFIEIEKELTVEEKGAIEALLASRSA